MPYFRENRHLLNLKLETKTLDGLRECQLGAYWAVLAHFTAQSCPALISLPTGSGKTAVMQILSFGLAANRVLVIEPSTILRDQVEEEFRTLSTLKQIGIIPRSFPSARSLSREGRINRKAEWDKFRRFDVVVATPHTTSPEQPGVVKPPDDLFDLVFIDEAHHAPAPTWAGLLSAFEKSKCVLLTATPFRRDKRRLQAHLIYSYPIARALENEIYRPVKYHPVLVTTPGELDDALSKAAKRVLTAENKLGNKSRLLVRTERVGNAAALIKLYDYHGIKLREVDYTKSLASNQKTLDDVRQGKLDGIVCVGMVGEGLDLPVLKIAVLHRSPRSLPFTLQFIGRVARFAPAQIGDAHLVASPDEVRGEVRKLYREDADWRKLIPDLVDNVLGHVQKLRHFRSTSPLGYLDINPMDLKPFHSVRVYSATPSQVNFETALSPDAEMQLCFAETDSTGRVLTIITETESSPPWAKETAITQTEYDLHIYFHSRPARLLFEYTTSDELASEIRRTIASIDLPLVTPQALLKAMKEAQAGDYQMVGLRNVASPGPSHPTYKTLMGSQVQAAVRLTDSRVFAPGHALARISDDETRGIGSMKGRIWSISRTKLVDFVKWCETLAQALSRTRNQPGLPQIEFLARPIKIHRLTERPIAIVLDDSLLRAVVRVTVAQPVGLPVTNDIYPSIGITSFDSGHGVVGCELHFSSSAAPVAIRYAADAMPQWMKTDGRDVHTRVEFDDQNIFEGDLLAFFGQFPPKLVCFDGGTLIGNTKWIPNVALGPLPTACQESKTWRNCDIQHEASQSPKNRLNVQEWVLEELTSITSKGAIIVKDHGSGELADFVVVEPDANPKRISFVHCKASGGAAAGARVDDLYEVLQQACRSAQWIASPGLMSEVLKHTAQPRSSPISKGVRVDLENLANHFRSNEWKFRVVAVQPGCEFVKALRSPRVYPLLVAAHQWLLDVGAEFSFWGS